MTEQGPYDDLVSRLQQLRADTGLPSYGDIAAQVSRVRRERGLSFERARVGRTTVYDAFRLGRQRIDADLIADIARALGVDDVTAAGWKEDALRARTPRTRDLPKPDLPAPAADPPEQQDEARELGARLVLKTLVACLALNLLGRGLVDLLGLPVYLDMVGTAFSAILLGPWWGALVGATTNLAGTAISGPDSLLFVPVNVIGALIWGYGARHGFARSIPRFFGLNLGVAVVCSCLAVPIIVVLAEGTIGHGADRITLSAMALVSSVWASVTVSNLLTSVVDKLICGFVSLAIVESLPARLRPKGWMQEAPGTRRVAVDAVRGCSGSVQTT